MKINLGLKEQKTMKLWEQFNDLRSMYYNKESLLQEKSKKVIKQKINEIGLELFNRDEISWVGFQSVNKKEISFP